MSTDFGGQSGDPWKWGYDENTGDKQNEWNWSAPPPGPPPQGYRPPPPQPFPETNSRPLKLPTHKSGSDFFENVHPNHTVPHPEQQSQFNATQPDSLQYQQANFLKNNQTHEVENKEVAPPDNRYPRVQFGFNNVQAGGVAQPFFDSRKPPSSQPPRLDNNPLAKESQDFFNSQNYNSFGQVRDPHDGAKPNDFRNQNATHFPNQNQYFAPSPHGFHPPAPVSAPSSNFPGFYDQVKPPHASIPPNFPERSEKEGSITQFGFETAHPGLDGVPPRPIPSDQQFTGFRDVNAKQATNDQPYAFDEANTRPPRPIDSQPQFDTFVNTQRPKEPQSDSFAQNQRPGSAHGLRDVNAKQTKSDQPYGYDEANVWPPRPVDAQSQFDSFVNANRPKEQFDGFAPNPSLDSGHGFRDGKQTKSDQPYANEEANTRPPMDPQPPRFDGFAPYQSLDAHANPFSQPPPKPQRIQDFPSVAQPEQKPQENQFNIQHFPEVKPPATPKEDVRPVESGQPDFPKAYKSSNLNQPMATSSPLQPENQELPEDVEPATDHLHRQMTALNLGGPEEKPHFSLDRNQYLETGHLSASKDSERPLPEPNDESDAPPPGLSRMVTGQVREPISLPVDIELESSPPCEIGSKPSSPLSSIEESEPRQRHSGTEESDNGNHRRLVQGQSIGDETDTGVREVPGEADPLPGRIVLGQMGRESSPSSQDPSVPRNESNRDREMGRRMVVGEQSDRDRDQPPSGNVSDDYRQQHRPRHRHRRGESSFDEDERDYSSDRDRRNEDFKRSDRNRRRREHRSPEFRSDEEFEERRGGYRNPPRGERRGRDREYSPDRDYYHRDYYREDARRHRRYDYNRERDREFEDEYYYRENRSSRPSSRSGSDYRRLNLDYSRSRHYYPDHSMTNLASGFPDMGKYPVNARAYEDYYETMRRMDPAGYAAWYNQYMANRYSMQQTANYSNDRASVHSGQSSSNQRQNVQTPQTGADESREVEEDYTPRLFTSAHVLGKLDCHSRLILVEPNYPADGQKSIIKFYQMNPMPSDEDIEEFFESPGPFIPGKTHRNTVLQYLKKISDKATKSSEKLLYDLIHLTVKGNGEVNGGDVAELLMNSYKSDRKIHENTDDVQTEKTPEKEVIGKFRELLQQGNKAEALEWAIEKGAWGHALFLASKMGDRTHNNIMLQFANSIPHNDPLQTLYQLMSGHVPQSSTCCADKKWSDWRPHLAMILGNPTSNPKVDRKAIIKLGDSLNARGRLFASHFCYITAQVEFSKYKPNAKLVLLGSSSNQDFSTFASCRAVMATMCYEYGLKLRQPNYSIPSLQLYKLILATRLIDHGKNRIALQYFEMIANESVQSGCGDRAVINSVIDISSRLKMLDPTLALTGETDLDPEWLSKLKNYCDSLPEDYDPSAGISRGISSSTVSEASQDVIQERQDARNNTQSLYDPYTANYNSAEIMNPAMPPAPLPTINNEEYQPAFMNPPMQNTPTQDRENFIEQPQNPTYSYDSNYWDNSKPNTGHESLYEPQAQTAPEPAPPPPQPAKNDFFKASEEQLKDVGDVKPCSKALNEVAQDNRESKPSESKREEAAKSGWFGGIWDKLSIRPKNQMRLPDDKNPSIVWDQEKKKWVNLDGESDKSAAVKPPPRVMAKAPAPQPNSLPTLPATTPAMPPPFGGNNYKIQKGKMMKSNYVDVMGKSNHDSQPKSLDSSLLPSMPMAPAQTTYFVPPPVEGNENAPIDFISPPSQPIMDNSDPSHKQLSRCSSVSSLSREVQYYMEHPGRARAPAVPPGAAPMMYNPSKFPS